MNINCPMEGSMLHPSAQYKRRLIGHMGIILWGWQLIG